MNNYQNILSYALPRTQGFQSVKKAIYLAEKSQAHITVLLVNQLLSPYEKWLKRNPEYNYGLSEKLEKIMEYAEERHANIDFHILDSSNSYQTFVEQLHADTYDLVVAEYEKENMRLWPFDNHEYSKLLKLSDKPILFVGDQPWHEHGHVIAALETEENSQTHQSFNKEIVLQAHHIAQLMTSEIHLVNCYLQDHSISCAIPTVNDASLSDYQKHLSHLMLSALPYHIDKAHLHIEQGFPEDVLPKEAQRYQANLVVLGSGEHEGILNGFKGHTIDFVINQLNCDLLALKHQTMVH
jgi:nucleotide-binding universal stress UspA family protein